MGFLLFLAARTHEDEVSCLLCLRVAVNRFVSMHQSVANGKTNSPPFQPCYSGGVATICIVFIDSCSTTVAPPATATVALLGRMFVWGSVLLSCYLESMVAPKLLSADRTSVCRGHNRSEIRPAVHLWNRFDRAFFKKAVYGATGIHPGKPSSVVGPI